MNARLFVNECSEWVNKEDENAIFDAINTQAIELPRIPNIGERFSYDSKDYCITATVAVIDTFFIEKDKSVEFQICLEDCYIENYHKDE